MMNIEEFEFIDDNGILFKVKKYSDGVYWLHRKHPDGGWITVRKVSHASFNDQPTDVEKMYERHCEQVNPRR